MRSFFCRRGRAKILPFPLPHKLFDLKRNLAKKLFPFLYVGKMLLVLPDPFQGMEMAEDHGRSRIRETFQGSDQRS